MLLVIEASSTSIVALPAETMGALQLSAPPTARYVVAYYRASLDELRLEPGLQREQARAHPAPLPAPLARFVRTATDTQFGPGGNSQALDAFRIELPCHRLVPKKQAVLPPMPHEVGVAELFADATGVFAVGQWGMGGARIDRVDLRTLSVSTVATSSTAIRGLRRRDGSLFFTSLNGVWRAENGALSAHVLTSTVPLRFPTALAEVGDDVFSLDSCAGKIMRYRQGVWTQTGTVPTTREHACDGCDFNDKSSRGGSLIPDQDGYFVVYRTGEIFRTTDFAHFALDEQVTITPICNSVLKRLSDGRILAILDPIAEPLLGFVRPPGGARWDALGAVGLGRFEAAHPRPGGRLWLRYPQHTVAEVHLGSAPEDTLACPVLPENSNGVWTLIDDPASDGLIWSRQSDVGNVVEWVDEVY